MLKTLNLSRVRYKNVVIRPETTFRRQENAKLKLKIIFFILKFKFYLLFGVKKCIFRRIPLKSTKTSEMTPNQVKWCLNVSNTRKFNFSIKNSHFY